MTAMSGHSHWATIKHKKGTADARGVAQGDGELHQADYLPMSVSGSSKFV